MDGGAGRPAPPPAAVVLPVESCEVNNTEQAVLLYSGTTVSQGILAKQRTPPAAGETAQQWQAVQPSRNKVCVPSEILRGFVGAPPRSPLPSLPVESYCTSNTEHRASSTTVLLMLSSLCARAGSTDSSASSSDGCGRVVIQFYCLFFSMYRYENLKQGKQTRPRSRTHKHVYVLSVQESLSNVFSASTFEIR